MASDDRPLTGPQVLQDLSSTDVRAVNRQVAGRHLGFQSCVQKALGVGEHDHATSGTGLTLGAQHPLNASNNARDIGLKVTLVSVACIALLALRPAVAG